ncbi:MAG: ATP-grasp domain-containing protein, partial [Bacteroidales bacterium]
HYYKNDEIQYANIAKICGFPCFVKPCNSGSSVGVTKVHTESELKMAIEEAFKYDRQLMIEKFTKGRELTCGVAVVNGKIQALAVTEITSSNEFYDYQSKYTDGMHNLITPADIPAKSEALIKEYSERIFHQLGCKGVIRVDFIMTAEGIPYFLEVNTVPGQTAMSIIPCQVTSLNIPLNSFYSNLIEEALKR